MKYFVVSDIHSFYKELKEALDLAGYDIKNRDHTLVIAGDLWDRGQETVKLFNFLKRIPKSRLILVKGNHEELLDELLEKKFPESHDFSNCTVRTCCHVANIPGIDDQYIKTGYYYSCGMMGDYERIDPRSQKAWDKVKKAVLESDFYKWMKTRHWYEWVELNDKFIIVHSFIPLTNVDGLPSYYTRNRKFEYRPTWREDATPLELSDSRWGCPWKLYRDGYFKEEEAKGKVLVCGHWHVSDFYENLCNEDSYEPRTDIFKLNGLIGIDCGVFRDPYDLSGGLIHPQNVLIINEDSSLENEFHQPIEDAKVHRRIETVTLTDEEYQELLKNQEK